MASLEELLAEEGFKRRTKERKDPSMDVWRGFKSRQRNNSTKSEEANIALPYICYERIKPVKETARSAPGSGKVRQRTKSGLAKPESVVEEKNVRDAKSDANRRPSTGRLVESRHSKSSADGWNVQHTNQIVDSRRSLERKHASKNNINIRAESYNYDNNNYQNAGDEEAGEARPTLDEAAVRAVISMLAGYCSRFLRDEGLRKSLRLKCASCLRVRNWEQQQYAEQAVIANLDWGIDGVEAVARNDGTKAAKMVTLHNATRMLSVAASLDADDLKDGFTCGLSNSALAACAHLYLAMTCKLQRNERMAALHLLEVFCVSPSQGRLHFARETWEHLFLPHLLHIKVWYNREMDSISSSAASWDSGKRLAKKLQKRLSKVYNEELDEGTRQFAVYYREWLMIGVKSRAVPSVKPPSTPLTEIRLQTPPPNLEVTIFAGREDSPAHESDLSATGRPLRKSLCEAVFGTPKRTELPYETTSGKPGGAVKRSKAVIPITDRTEVPVLISKPDSSRENRVATVLEEAEELEIGSDDHEMERDTCYMEEGSAEMAGKYAKGAEDWGLKTDVILDGKELYEEELLQLWEHMLNSSTFSEKCSIIRKLSERDGNGLTLKKLGDIVFQIQQSKTSMNSISPLSSLSSTDMIEANSGSERETEPTHSANQGGKNGKENNSVPTSTNPISLKSGSGAGLTAQDVNVYFRQSTMARLSRSSVSCKYRTASQLDLISLGEDSPKQFSSKLKGNNHMETLNTKCLLTGHFSQNMKESCDPVPSIPQTLLTSLKEAVTTLCISDSLRECEGSVQAIADVWQESKGDPIVEAILSKTAIIDELMELLPTSKNEGVLRTIIGILAELAIKNESNRETILRADPDLKVIVRILSSRMFPQAAILLHLLEPQASQLASLDIISLLLRITKNTNNSESSFPVSCTPQAAVVFLLEQLLTALDDAKNIENAKQVIAREGIPFLVSRIELGNLQERISAASVLRCCMHADGSCRHALVRDIKKASIVELLHSNQGASKTVAIAFLMDLLCLNRRALISKFLSELQEEGLLNTMHVLLVYLQTAPLEQQPMAATLLLQLDLLVGPRRYSVYREEALDALVFALHCEKNTKAQVQSAKALLALEGRFSYFGRSLSEAWLLKKAGLENDFTDSLKEEQGPLEEIVKKWNEEKMAADDWERKTASVLLANGKSLFAALAKSLSSEMPEVAKPCLVTATWLNCALASMPDTGMQLIACSTLLPQLVKSLQPDRQLKERVLASLSLHSYMKNPECLHLLSNYARETIGPLRRLKWITWTAKEVLNVIANDPLLRSYAQIFVHGEVAQMDASVNGGTQALIYGMGKLYSGHADGSIKVWDLRNQQPKLISVVKEHKRPITCLAISESSGRLFSASADKSIRIWKLHLENLECIEVVQMKELVTRICIQGQLTFIVSDRHGIKVLDNSGTTKVLNGNKHVHSLAVAGNKVYSSCTDWSIQEVDLGSGEVMNMQLGQRTLLGKKSAVHALQVFKEFLYTAGNSVDGLSAQIWKLKNRSLAATIAPSADVKAMVVNEDFIYLGCNSSTGLIEVWLREKLQKVAVIHVGSKLTALAFGEDALYSASEDGRIRAWAPI